MSEMLYCQSCAMPITKEEEKGTNQDGSKNQEYCCYCYQNGSFTLDGTMEDMIAVCVPMTVKSGVYPDEQTALEKMRSYFPQLKRWKEA